MTRFGCFDILKEEQRVPVFFYYLRTTAMRNSKLFTFMLCIGTIHSGTVKGFVPPASADDIITHTDLTPEPLAAVDNAYRLAATWWLPDWQDSQKSRGNQCEGGVCEGGDLKGDCGNYGLYQTCPSPKISTGITHPTSDLTCQKSCYCPANYQYTSSNCSGNREPSGGSCDGKYNACSCKKEFKYNSSNCNGENELGGTSCDGNYNSCTVRPECTVSSKSCTYGCKTYNSCDRCTECKTNPDCDVSSKSCTYGCASYNSCSKCTSCKENPDCSVTPVSCTYGCASTNSCGICISCAGNPDCNVSSKSCDYGCSSYNSCDKCISCKSCTPYSDETGCSYGSYSCSDGCGGTRTCCSSKPACTPYSDETGCSYGTYSCSDGCGGTRTCCSSNPCAGTTCPSGVTCGSEGCATYSSATSCCSSVCTQCNEPSPSSSPDPCAGISCPSNKSCTYGCASYSSATSCCSSVCTACKSAPQPEPSPSPSPSSSPSPTDPCAGGYSCSTGCAEYSSECSSKCIRCKPSEAQCRKMYPDYNECVRGGSGCKICDDRSFRMPAPCDDYFYQEARCASW